MLNRWVSVIVVLSFGLLSCYNTYRVSPETFAGLQRSEDGNPVTVRSSKGKNLVVTQDSKLFVLSDGGRRYPITPFNFKMTGSQLVAPDRDYILKVNSLKAFEVDVPSRTKTLSLILGSVTVVAGAIVGLYFVYGQKTVGSN